jgi:membrane associated rhomboid family serine protease
MEDLPNSSENVREYRKFRTYSPNRWSEEDVRADRRKLWFSAIFAAFLLTVIWIVHLFNWAFDLHLSRFGLEPRTLNGLLGILFAPLLHGDWNHLLSNSLPLLLLFGGTLYFYRGIGFRVLAWIWIFGGLGVWLIGRDSYHIGASGLLYGFAAFLATSGVIRNDTRLMAVSLLTIFLYGSMIWGVLPLFKHVSWESHLMGALVGLISAIVYRHEGPPKPQYFLDEDEEPEEAAEQGVETPDTTPQSTTAPGVRIIYIYTKPEEPEANR